MAIDYIPVYSYDSLPTESAKAKAFEEVRNHINGWFDNGQLTDWFKCTLAELGYTDMDVRWSLNYCQGDGVAFYGLISDTSDMLKIAKRVLHEDQFEMFKRLHEVAEFYIDITSLSNHYAHYNTMAVCVDTSGSFDDIHDAGIEDEVETMTETLREAVAQDVKDVSRRLEKDGYADIEYNVSDENVREMIQNNDFRFYEDGRMA